MQAFSILVPLLLALSQPIVGSPTCIVPLVIFETLDKPFTLSALVPSKPYQQNSWPVQLSPRTPSEATFSKPIISNTKIAQPSFKLTDGQLVNTGFDAYALPIPLIFPPPLQGWGFGGKSGGAGNLNFTAGYACDEAGKQYLRLNSAQCKWAPSRAKAVVNPERYLNYGGNSATAVKSAAEGQQILLKPKDFQGK
ncbi:MAG: hypothetical protein M1825_003950 [Sarcosagium campestre]|nr:MAG: hypothetical protein M1825_003950 [Sarcosagium campestre]